MKQTAEFTVVAVERPGAGGQCALLRLAGPEGLAAAEARPGSFVNVAVEGVGGKLLRRPISVCNVDDEGLLWLLVRDAGPATHRLVTATRPGDRLNLLCFLGRGFTLEATRKPLLVGGGVGIAPMLLTARELRRRGAEPTVLVAAASAPGLMLLPELARYATVAVATDDGSAGHHGFAHTHPLLAAPKGFDACMICGPLPMMKACAAAARRAGIGRVEVSLENSMACGLGACLCCVEDTRDEGNLTVCTHGPVFNIDRLKWNLQ